MALLKWPRRPNTIISLFARPFEQVAIANERASEREILIRQRFSRELHANGTALAFSSRLPAANDAAGRLAWLLLLTELLAVNARDKWQVSSNLWPRSLPVDRYSEQE